MIQLWLTRHGETQENIDHVCCGQSQGQITDLGIRQAQELGKRLHKEEFTKAYVSDLLRTKLTYQHISHYLENKCQHECTNILREKCHGIYTFQDLNIPKKVAAEQKVHIRQFKPEQGESYAEVFDRATQFLQLLVDNHLNDDETFSKILAVSHRGFIMEFMNVVNLIKDKTEPIYKETSSNCSITMIEITKQPNYQGLQDLAFKVVIQNDNSHCKKLELVQQQ